MQLSIERVPHARIEGRGSPGFQVRDRRNARVVFGRYKLDLGQLSRDRRIVAIRPAARIAGEEPLPDGPALGWFLQRRVVTA